MIIHIEDSSTISQSTQKCIRYFDRYSFNICRVNLFVFSSVFCKKNFATDNLRSNINEFWFCLHSPTSLSLSSILYHSFSSSFLDSDLSHFQFPSHYYTRTIITGLLHRKNNIVFVDYRIVWIKTIITYLPLYGHFPRIGLLTQLDFGVLVRHVIDLRSIY